MQCMCICTARRTRSSIQEENIAHMCASLGCMHAQRGVEYTCMHTQDSPMHVYPHLHARTFRWSPIRALVEHIAGTIDHAEHRLFQGMLGCTCTRGLLGIYLNHRIRTSAGTATGSSGNTSGVCKGCDIELHTTASSLRIDASFRAVAIGVESTALPLRPTCTVVAGGKSKSSRQIQRLCRVGGEMCCHRQCCICYRVGPGCRHHLCC